LAGGSAGGTQQALAVLECKTASAFSRHGWGTAGTDQVPPHYLLQCVWYMALTGCPSAELAVLIGNNDFRIYSVARDLELEAAVIERVERFWHDHVIAKASPKALRPEDASIAWPQEQGGAAVQASEEIVSALELYRHHSALATRAERECERLKAEIMSFMGSAERLTVGGHTVATWRCASPALRLDARLLAQEHPGLAAAYSKRTPGARRFLLKEPT
jgi:predicted phage-related endonuclease